MRTQRTKRPRPRRDKGPLGPLVEAERFTQEEVDRLFIEFSEGSSEAGFRLALSVVPLCLMLVRRCNKTYYYRLGADDLSHDLLLHLFGKLPKYDSSRGMLTTWASWETRAFMERKTSDVVYVPRKVLRENPDKYLSLSNFDWSKESLHRKDVETGGSLRPEDIAEVLVALTVGTRDRAIMGLRLEGKTLTEIGVVMGISRERVRQILGSTFDRIRFYYGRSLDLGD